MRQTGGRGMSDTCPTCGVKCERLDLHICPKNAAYEGRSMSEADITETEMRGCGYGDANGDANGYGYGTGYGTGSGKG